jgi:undecaprenyl diphosphate synthase
MEGRVTMASSGWRGFLGRSVLKVRGHGNDELEALPAGVAVPTHLAVIMDGNGRWARRRGLPRQAGHRQGAENLHRIVDACGRYGVKFMTVYAFSTENWSRPDDEVSALMDLFLEFLVRFDEELEKVGIRLRFLGDRVNLPQSVRDAVELAERKSMDRTNMQFIIALNYGGRREIVQAAASLARDAVAGRIDPDLFDEAIFASRLYLPDVPDPDLVIRPSGEQRLSNFLLWESAYAEFWYSNVLWPDFSAHDLVEAFKAYTARDRRFGGVKG